MTKQEARTTYLARRLALSDGEKEAREAGLLEQFGRLVFPPIKTIHVYQPILSKNEIDTLPFIRHLERLFPGLRLVLPRVSGPTTLEHLVWDAGTLFSTSPWGTPEPVGGVSVPARDIDLVLVPLVIFDREGYRVGYGKGFYDRFLSACRTDVLKVGLSLFEPLPHLQDRAEFDVPLSIGVTPTQLYEFV
jgi:5-formyltetrahydrofolate cyclo-ligase